MTQYKWWQTGVIYQIYPRSFNDSNDDGIGDIRGIIEKLDYLVDLGIDAIWISPIYPSPMKDFGYDVADFCDIEPIFGDMGDFDELLEKAHARGLKVVLDYVPNHSSDQHEWFIESRSSKDSDKRDWYIWADAKPDGSPPNNWMSYFGGPTWTWDENTEQYYLHLFTREQPDLNWRNPDVRTAMYDALRYWLDKGVDGFRIDVISLVIKDDKLRDNPEEPPSMPSSPHDLQQRIFSSNRPESHEVIREMRQVFDEYDDRVAIGEIYLRPRSWWVKYYGKQGDELHLPFNFELLNQTWTASAMRQSVDELEYYLPDGAWPNYVLGNHDQKRLATRFGRDAVRVAAMMLLTLRGTPTIYMGDEIGMPDGHVPEDRIVDPPALNLGLEFGRDGCRTPIQWSDSDFAGFSTVEPWLPVGETYQDINVEAQQKDPQSVLQLYQSLLKLRKETPALNRGRYEPINHIPDTIFAYIREYDDDRYLIALNFSDKATTIAVEFVAEEGEILLSTELDRDGKINLENIELRSNEGVIVSI